MIVRFLDDLLPFHFGAYFCYRFAFQMLQSLASIVGARVSFHSAMVFLNDQYVSFKANGVGDLFGVGGRNRF